MGYVGNAENTIRQNNEEIKCISKKRRGYPGTTSHCAPSELATRYKTRKPYKSQHSDVENLQRFALQEFLSAIGHCSDFLHNV